MFKLGFLVFLVACAMQHTFVTSIPVNANSHSYPKEVEVVGHAVFDVVKAVKEFIESAASNIQKHALFGLSRTALTIILKVHVVASAAVPGAFKSNENPEELKQNFIIANAVLQLRERLDKMEKTEDILNRAVDETASQILTYKLNLNQGVKVLYGLLDKNFKDEPTLREIYAFEKEKIQKEFKIEIDREYKSIDDIPEDVKQKLMRSGLNKLFLHHIDNRITTFRKEYFILARSTVELAKDSSKFEKVQNIYRKTLSEVTPTLNPRTSGPFEAAENLFGKLRENFKKYPSLDAELQRLQDEVSKRDDWNKSIWDWDIIFI